MVRMDDSHPRRGQGGRVLASAPTAGPRWAPGCAWPRGSSRPCPVASQKHAILLTDGENQHETPEALTAGHRRRHAASSSATAAASAPTGRSTRCAASPPALLGTVDLIPRAGADGRRVREADAHAMGRGVAQRRPAGLGPAGRPGPLRPPGRRPRSRTSPHAVTAVNALTGAYPTGSWGDESRDYHVAVRLAAKGVGQEQLAARVQLAVGDEVVAQGLVKALWSSDDDADHPDQPGGRALHRPGRAGRGDPGRPGREGRRRRRDGDRQARPRGPARRRDRQRRGDLPAAQGRRRRGPGHRARCGCKRAVEKLDEMALDTASTKTTRVQEMSASAAPTGTTPTADGLLRRLRRADRAAAAGTRPRRRPSPRLRPPSPGPPAPRPRRATAPGVADLPATVRRRQRRRSRSSARPAATTSPPAPCRGPRTATARPAPRPGPGGRARVTPLASTGRRACRGTRGAGPGRARGAGRVGDRGWVDPDWYAASRATTRARRRACR